MRRISREHGNIGQCPDEHHKQRSVGRQGREKPCFGDDILEGKSPAGFRGIERSDRWRPILKAKRAVATRQRGVDTEFSYSQHGQMNKIHIARDRQSRCSSKVAQALARGNFMTDLARREPMQRGGRFRNLLTSAAVPADSTSLLRASVDAT